MTMKNAPRDVTGGDAVMSGLVPGLGFFNYLLGLFSVPIEVFLRRDFGERYFTKANFIAGLLVLIMFRFVTSIFSFLSLLNPMNWLSNSGPSPESWMGSVIKYYIYLSIAHFLRIWWNDITGNRVHSYASGRSWLRPVGRLTMGILNIFLNAAVRLLFKIIPNARKEKLDDALPVLQDIDTFTERFIEPFAVFVFALYCSGAGQTSMVIWLMISFLALQFSTSPRHQAQRSFLLDFRDSIIEYRDMQGGNSPGSGQMRKIVKETAREAEKTPEIMQVVQQQHPTIADAMAAVNPKLRKKEPTENSSANAFNGAIA